MSLGDYYYNVHVHAHYLKSYGTELIKKLKTVPMIPNSVQALHIKHLTFHISISNNNNIYIILFCLMKSHVAKFEFFPPFDLSGSSSLLSLTSHLYHLSLSSLPFLSLYTMQLMLECKNKAVRGMSPQEKEEFNYTQLGKRAFDTLSVQLAELGFIGKSVKLGFIGKWAVDLSVLGCNLGVCAGYMIFIASNLRVSIMYMCAYSMCFCRV